MVYISETYNAIRKVRSNLTVGKMSPGELSKFVTAYSIYEPVCDVDDSLRTVRGKAASYVLYISDTCDANRKVRPNLAVGKKSSKVA